MNSGSEGVAAAACGTAGSPGRPCRPGAGVDIAGDGLLVDFVAANVGSLSAHETAAAFSGASSPVGPSSEAFVSGIALGSHVLVAYTVNTCDSIVANAATGDDADTTADTARRPGGPHRVVGTVSKSTFGSLAFNTTARVGSFAAHKTGTTWDTAGTPSRPFRDHNSVGTNFTVDLDGYVVAVGDDTFCVSGAASGRARRPFRPWIVVAASLHVAFDFLNLVVGVAESFT